VAKEDRPREKITMDGGGLEHQVRGKKQKQKKKKKKTEYGGRHKIPKRCPITETKTEAERGERGAKRDTTSCNFKRVCVERKKRKEKKNRQKVGDQKKKIK